MSAGWAEALCEKLAGPSIPHDAISVKDAARMLIEKKGVQVTERAMNSKMDALAKSGAYIKAFGQKNGTDARACNWYWPAPAPNPKRKT